MTNKTVFQTDGRGIYVGTTHADPSPLEPGAWLIPGGCVEVAPPEIPEHKAAYWNGAAWELVNYYQGLIVYSIVTGEPLELSGIQTIPSGYTVKQPGPDQVWKSGEWVDDTAAILAKLYQEKLTEISRGCSEYIEGGFDSTALGEPHAYPSALEDQVNLTGLIFSGLDGAYPCTGASGERQYLPHTAEQLNLVNKDLVRFKQAALQHADQLKRDLSQALQDKKLKAMRAITWTVPA
ncbi:hypothetical protein C4Q28_03145 [Pseudomonas sp. SWI6]|uniref:DUF4376 domain-containing protein n=1 Tax=Pseudomonas sp. SWI6 TaxID=2083051 RepID=UPI000CE5DA79|nr:hypothetical protein [Pseudomonas sp. SWI6]AVD81229.1 hypothetical protein C4Q28_03145 [Pseudomonas sp. SWI6]